MFLFLSWVKSSIRFLPSTSICQCVLREAMWGGYATPIMAFPAFKLWNDEEGNGSYQLIVTHWRHCKKSHRLWAWWLVTFLPFAYCSFPFKLLLVCVNQPKVLSMTVTTNICMNRMARRLDGDIRKCVRRSITAAGICGGRSMGTDCLISAQSGYCPSLSAMEKSWDKCLLK